ncbi:outer membrane protein assembly factor [Melioribacteraceae bacterium 4301-Me]|uniref:BamA/OMP85 family outer membrane protein n=1 Tax=Pyranulibacter aquaticus TaxID=3163344 RepID=UPI0035991757
MIHLIQSRKLIFVLLITNSVFPQTIKSIEVKGSVNFPETEYINWCGASIGAKFNKELIDTVKKNIANNLSAEGFYNFSFNYIQFVKEDSLSYKLLINIDEGNPTFIKNINFTSNFEDTSVIKDYLDELKNKIFSRENINVAFNNILDSFENNGYPFAVIKIISVEFFDDTLSNEHQANLQLEIDKNVRAKIDYINITGNTKTKSDVIIRATGIRKGELYSQKLIDDIPDKLNKLNFFKSVEKPTYYLNTNNEGILNIKIEEQQTNNFDGVIGYVPSSSYNESGYFTGFVNIGLRNLFGTARNASIRWQQENPSTQELEFHYLEPWILNYPFNLEAGFFQRKQDSTYIQRSLSAQLEFLATDEISASFLISNQTTIPTERKVNVFTVFNSSTLTTGLSFKIDRRNDIYSPTRGLIFISSLKSNTKRITGPASYITTDTKTKINYQRIEADLELFHQLFTNQVIKLGLHARELKGNDFEISDLYFLGGTNTLRGYKEKQFQGNRIFWSNFEYRYLLEKRTFIFVFFDTGYYLRNEDLQKNILFVSDYKYGYGLGLNIETSLGILNVSFALGKGDSFSQGKIHFGLINNF